MDPGSLRQGEPPIAYTGKFGNAVTFSADASLIVVGSWNEHSNATGINGNQSNTSASESGAAYIIE